MTGMLLRLVTVGLTSRGVEVMLEGEAMIITSAVTSGGGVMVPPAGTVAVVVVGAVVTVVGEGLLVASEVARATHTPASSSRDFRDILLDPRTVGKTETLTSGPLIQGSSKYRSRRSIGSQLRDYSLGRNVITRT